MRPYHFLYFALAASPALAQGAAPSQPADATQAGHHMPLTQRFAAANTTNDGHLTLAQAQSAGWRRVVIHFSEIDQGAKGYVTMADIRAFNRAMRAAKRAAPGQPGQMP